MSLIIDVVTAGNLVDMVNNNVKQYSSKVIIATEVSVKGFVDTVIKEINGDEKTKGKKISALRIWGHAHLYKRLADGGLADATDGDVIFGSDTLSAETIDSYKDSLAPLAIYFAQPARAELRGCHAALGEGKKMMTKLAAIWKVNVYASENNQFQPSWSGRVCMTSPTIRCAERLGIEVAP